MWCLETLEKIGIEAAKGKDAYATYEAVGIRILGNTPRVKKQCRRGYYRKSQWRNQKGRQVFVKSHFVEKP